MANNCFCDLPEDLQQMIKRNECLRIKINMLKDIVEDLYKKYEEMKANAKESDAEEEEENSFDCKKCGGRKASRAAKCKEPCVGGFEYTCKFCGKKDIIMAGNKCDTCRKEHGID